MEIKVLLHEEDGGYWAEVPSMPGCFSEGDTREEIIENIKEAISLWLSSEPLTTKHPCKCDEVLYLAI